MQISLSIKIRSLHRSIFWGGGREGKHFSDNHCDMYNRHIMRGFEFTADIFYTKEDV